MTSSQDFHRKIDKLDEDIIRLLNERVTLCQETEDEDPEALGSDYQIDTLSHYEGAADEKGWSPVLMNRLCKAIVDLCKHAGE